MSGKEENREQQCQVQILSGQVEVTGPAEGGKGAVLTPGENVLLWVNGREIKKSCRVYPQDKIKLAGVIGREEAQIKVKIAADLMSAEAIYYPPRIIRYLVSDHPPVTALQITASREEEIVGPDLDGGEIRARLAAAGVVYGIKESALAPLIEQAESGRKVAVGTPPVQGKNGYVEFLFKEGLQEVSYDDKETRVDYKKRYEIPQVDRDQPIAKIHPPRPGEPGMTVTGRKIEPDPVYPAEVCCEAGVALNENKTAVMATRKGVPVCRRGRQVILRVDNIYLHRGDIDIKSGHTNFAGHLKIAGGIEEGMRVKAEGDIEIADHASGAEITAGGSIIFNRNCIKCVARAGWLTFQLKEIGRLYEDLTISTGLFLEMGRELISSLEERGSYTDLQISFLLRSLMQKKFPDLPTLSMKILNLGRELAADLPELLVATVEKYSQYLQGPGSLLTWDLLREIQRELTVQQELLRFSDPETAGITAYYVQNSRLTCPGDIEITGPGAYNSAFECGGRVRIVRIFRGGSIKAGGDIFIGEAGIPRSADMQGVIETGRRGKVHVEKIYESTRIKIGKPEIYLDRDLSRVRFYQDEEGDIKFSPLGK